MTQTEREQRIHLAACYRVLAHLGVEDLTYNHLSLRVKDEPDTMLIKQGTEMFCEVTASSLRKYRFDGTPMDGGPPLVGGSLVIHAGILQARPDINAVFHTHTPANMGVASQKHGLLMINQHAVKFYKRLAYHDFGGYEFNMSQRAPLLASLGTHRVALLRNHGALVCGRTLQEALVDHNYLEMACRGQIAALAGGAQVYLIPDEVAEFGASQINVEDPAASGAKDWAACLRLAYRLDPGFAN
ncbi:class II aldolase/adducin family protein [uncultured Pigmentiphaga sp.]|uniref:class II aldolase/adducin family protein n=1 Tax=uncultured Pigmentiphaga sp. TaxID=340361 RepID=UPI002620660E|nr:class II aldolase/adducin family protein [uncultured Pigmentiphaga sp.]